MRRAESGAAGIIGVLIFVDYLFFVFGGFRDSRSVLPEKSFKLGVAACVKTLNLYLWFHPPVIFVARIL